MDLTNKDNIQQIMSPIEAERIARSFKAKLHTAEAERDALQAKLAVAVAALKPFAGCVYNDNGDVTITTSNLRTRDYMTARAALAQLTHDAPPTEPRYCIVTRLHEKSDFWGKELWVAYCPERPDVSHYYADTEEAARDFARTALAQLTADKTRTDGHE